MNLTNNLFFTLLAICVASYATAFQKNDVGNAGQVTTKQTKPTPNVDITLSLEDTVFRFGNPILLNISLTNNGHEEQKLLFDKPAISTGGPWAITGKVTDVMTKASVLKYQDKAMLSSQIYSEDQLKDHYYYLKPGDTIHGQYRLSAIVVFNSSDYLLPKGMYEVQLFYYSNPSNVVTIRIE